MICDSLYYKFVYYINIDKLLMLCTTNIISILNTHIIINLITYIVIKAIKFREIVHSIYK